MAKVRFDSLTVGTTFLQNSALPATNVFRKIAPEGESLQWNAQNITPLSERDVYTVQFGDGEEVFVGIDAARLIWQALGAVGIDDNRDTITERFLMWPDGTPRTTIWKWLELTFGVTLNDDMGANVYG
jgi:hypothetical protein